MGLLLALLIAQAQTVAHGPADAAREVQAHIDSEQNAFFAGKCDETVTHWSETFTMVVEGEVRASNRPELQKLCQDVMKMVASGRIPSGASGPKIIARDIYMLSDEIGYEVTRRLTPDGSRSSVTKVVARQPDGWKITHMHEAIAKSRKQD